MKKKKVFISFDYDNDSNLKDLFIGQSKNDDSPFEITDFSIKEAIASNWKEHARRKIKDSDLVIFICGRHTHDAKGVTAEMSITQEENKKYFLLKGYRGVVCTKPINSKWNDFLEDWNWDNLKKLIHG